LAIIYPSNLSKEENALRLGSVAGDLSGKSIEQIRDACKRYRVNGENRFFPTSGQLLDLMKNPYADAPGAHRHTERHGGGCQCSACFNKTPREGFFKAPGSDYHRDLETQRELDEWMRKRMATIVPDPARAREVLRAAGFKTAETE
jgi:hypothetical protein